MAMTGGLAAARADGPAHPSKLASESDEAPIPIFLNAPSDLAAFWKMLARPDFVILDGDQYRKLRQGTSAPAPAAPDAPSSAPIELVEVSGEVAGDWAHLSIRLKVAITRDGP